MKNGLGFGKRALCLVLCMGLLLLSSVPVAAQERDPVRVGFFAFEGYHGQAEDGTRFGYGYELLQHLAGYGGFTYEYVGYDKSWSEMQDMLERGEIDLLTSAQKTPERLARFDFSESAIGISATILTVKAGDSRFLEGERSLWNGIRVGMLKDNSRNDSFDRFARERSLSYTPVYFGSVDEMVSELKSGAPARSVDALVTSDLRQIKDEWILAQFDPSPFYIMVRKGDSALLERVDNAIALLDDADPSLHTELMNKYYSADSGAQIAFSSAERDYIKRRSATPVTALAHPDNAPYSWFENGKMQGIFCDAAQALATRCGLTLEFLNIGSIDEYKAALKDGAADICFDADCDYTRAETQGYWLTDACIELPAALLHRETLSEYNTVGFIHGGNTAPDYLAELAAQGCRLLEYASVKESVEALIHRKTDAVLLGVAAAKRAVWEDPTSFLAVQELSGVYSSCCVAVSHNSDPLLYSLVSKAAASFKEQDMRPFAARYEPTGEKQIDFIGYCANHPLHAAVAIMGFIIFAALLLWLRRSLVARREAVARQAEEERRSALLANALAAAERADAAKSQFLSRVSHEMRTPLNAIIGFLELARGERVELARQYLDNADLAAKQLLGVINDVLDMSSIDSGKLKLASNTFDLKQLLSSLTNLYLAQCSAKGLGFETRILTPLDEWLVGDQLRVNQILINLLGNAVKFTDSGHIWLTVQQHDASENRVFLRFEVSDTGCGMSSEMQARLFRPFEQESAKTAQRYGGNGLGLSIVKSLVAMMDGAVRVESQPGEGSTFTVDLPFERSEAGRALRLPEGAGELHVLAVDDEESERRYISTVLEHIGVRYRCVADGDAALAELTRSEKEGDLYNLCLIDWRMPNMDGIETTRRIRALYGEHLVVIVVSAYDRNQAGEGARSAGANLFVSKPLFQSTLFDLFMTLTGGHLAKKPPVRTLQDFTGRRVLLAEDNAMNRLVAEGLIRRLGIQCDTVEDGKLAVERFLASKSGWYDAILMDIQMPNMDGFEATAAIRASSHPDAARVQIIALTANAFKEDIAKTLSAGMNAHVAKPIEPGLLTFALERAFVAKDSDAQ